MLNASSPAVVLVILTCNQKEITLDCMQSLRECNYQNKRVVLVDNGSEDGTLQEVNTKYPEIHTIRNERNLGAAAGRNVGIEYANKNMQFDFMMFMDNDIVVNPTFLDKLVGGLQKYEDKGVEIASPKLYLMGTRDIIDCAGGAKVNFYLGSTLTRGHGEQDTGQYDDNYFPKCVPTTVLMRRSALERAGKFDVSFDPYGYEDIDMVLRANMPGAPFLFVPDAVVYHKGSKTGFDGYSGEYTRVKAANFRRFLQRHSTSFQRFCFYCLLPVLASKTIFRELKKGNFSTIIGLIKGFFKT